MSWRRRVVANGPPVWIWRLGIGQTQNSILDPSWDNSNGGLGHLDSPMGQVVLPD